MEGSHHGDAVHLGHPPSGEDGDPVHLPGFRSTRRRSSSVPNLHIAVEDERKKKKQSKHPLRQYRIENYNHAESLYSVVSVLYAVFITVMGATLPIAELFAKNSKVPTESFEGFYVYLFVASISFLIFVQLFIIRNQKDAAAAMWQNFVAKCRGGRTETDSSAPASGSRFKGLEGGRTKKTMTLNSHAHSGGFFLRLGAVGFGIGAMILEGLNFGVYLENDPRLECSQLTEVVRPPLQMIFILSQTYFIFRNSKMVVHKYRVLVKFGMMHMVATNLCVWLRVIAIETMHELHHADGSHHHDDSHHSDHSDHYIADHGNFSRHRRGGYDDIITTNETYQVHDAGCDDHELSRGLLSQAVDKVGPYLFACTVEYSLIEAGVMYLMWCNICPGQGSSTSHALSVGGHSHSKPMQRIRMDWSGTNRGLFLGIFILTLTIISLIVFFNLKARNDSLFQYSAIILMLATKLFIDSISLVAVCGAAVKFHDLRFEKNVENNLDQILLLVALVGVYLFNILCAIAATYRVSTSIGSLSLVTNIICLLQSTIQTLFILNGLRRSAASKQHEIQKPGRQFVTFLVVTNTALWGINSFEILHAGSHPTAMEFFGFIPWSIITHVSVPLAIFYRYHSTVCLVDIWKDAYKTKSHNAHH